jgi:hypothetical protein
VASAGHIRAVGDRKRGPGAEEDDTRDLPAAQQVAFQPLLCAQERKFIEDVHVEHVRTVPV